MGYVWAKSARAMDSALAKASAAVKARGRPSHPLALMVAKAGMRGSLERRLRRWQEGSRLDAVT